MPGQSAGLLDLGGSALASLLLCVHAASAAMHKSSRIMLAAVKFFLGTDKADNADRGSEVGAVMKGLCLVGAVR